jgi:hypothetical protein
MKYIGLAFVFAGFGVVGGLCLCVPLWIILLIVNVNQFGSAWDTSFKISFFGLPILGAILGVILSIRFEHDDVAEERRKADADAAEERRKADAEAAEERRKAADRAEAEHREMLAREARGRDRSTAGQCPDCQYMPVAPSCIACPRCGCRIFVREIGVPRRRGRCSRGSGNEWLFLVKDWRTGDIYWDRPGFESRGG